MRTLNECKAEIFRRSDEKLEIRRRKRKRVLYTTLPVIVCVFACAAIILPNTLFLKSDSGKPDDFAPNGSVEADEPGVNEEAFLCVEKNGEVLMRVTDSEDTRNSYNGISELFEAKAESSGDTISPEIGVGSVGGDSNHDCYTFTFSIDGEEEKFVLSGDTLKRVSTGEKITVSPERLEEIIGF